jgi:hypothetical protein
MCIEVLEEKRTVFNKIEMLFNDLRKKTEEGESETFKQVASDIYEKKERKTLEKIKKIVGEVIDRKFETEKKIQHQLNKQFKLINIILCIIITIFIIISIISWIPSFGLLFGGRLINVRNVLSSSKPLVIDSESNGDLISVMGNINTDIKFRNILGSNRDGLKEKLTLKEQWSDYPLLLNVNRTGLFVPRIYVENAFFDNLEVDNPPTVNSIPMNSDKFEGNMRNYSLFWDKNGSIKVCIDIYTYLYI